MDTMTMLYGDSDIDNLIDRQCGSDCAGTGIELAIRKMRDHYESLRRYTHRNGETEPPTEPGAYWFKGAYYDGRVGDERFKRDEQLLIQAEQWDDHSLHFDEFASDEGRRVENFAGQWWGPLTPPWETE